MTLVRRRQEDGSLGQLEKVFDIFTDKEQIESLGFELVLEKIKNSEQSALIEGLGTQIVDLRIELMKLKGGE